MSGIRAAGIVTMIALWLPGPIRAGGPDHLVPVNPHPSKSTYEYRAKLDDVLGVSKFELDDDGHFLDGAVVALIQEPFDPETLLVFGRGTITRVSPDRNIHYSMPGHRSRKRENRRKRIEVQRASIDLGEERSQRVAGLIEKLSRDTRYPAVDLDGVEDSTVYEFRLRSKRLFGEATSEASGPAKRLIDIVDAIARLDIGPDGRVSEDTLKKLDRMCEELESAIEARPNRRG